MNLRQLLLGVAGGAIAGYAGVRALQALNVVGSPRPVVRNDRADHDRLDYVRIRRGLALAGTLRGIAATVTLAHGPISDAFDRATRCAPVWLRPALFGAGASLAGAAVELGISLVEDYDLERRFGLSDQPLAAWLTDYAKSAAVSTAFTALLAGLFGWVVRRVPQRWPVVAAAGALPLFVLANIVVPLAIMPLFNAFVPLDGPLERRLRALATRYGVGDAEILRMDMSRQTRKANAFVTGIGSTHRIVIGDTLLETLTDDEIEFVVAHELGHYVSHDTWRLIAAGELFIVVLLWIARASNPQLASESERERALAIARLYGSMFVWMQLLNPLLLAFSRSREWAADRFGLEATGNRETAAAALRKLRDLNLADDDPPVWYEVLFGSHPSLRARIEAVTEG